MNLINSSDYLIHNATLGRNSTLFPEPAKMFAVPLLFTSFLVGTIINGLYLWVLRFKMKRTVNILLFFHLILSYFMSAFTLPFVATSYLQDNHWRFGIVMCKVVNSTLSLGMFTSVFFLSAISVDRYLLVLYPVWSQLHRTPRNASIIILGIWISAMALSMPYLFFRVTHENDDKTVTCQNNYVVFTKGEHEKMETLSKKIHLACFIGRFLVGFLLPFFIITFCYERINNKVKERSRIKSNKPFRVMVTAIISFFVCWMPYHIYKGLRLTSDQSQSHLSLLFLILTLITTSFNALFSPTLYLFTGEDFKKIFKKSIIALFESTFNEDSSAERTQNINSEADI
ncbi:probable G-protein coupled receptor 33 [Sorex araneus]|uniref:probable G-protein coupled receptor 33 n=1 Tax=Sorex araneus TaxID=42254 RepID=UPI002433BEC4|nr:probable G-protein coupled receptor 33 [Sorex araneus]